MSEKDIIVLCGVLIISVIVVIIASKLGARDGRLKAKDVIIDSYKEKLYNCEVMLNDSTGRESKLLTDVTIALRAREEAQATHIKNNTMLIEELRENLKLREENKRLKADAEIEIHLGEQLADLTVRNKRLKDSIHHQALDEVIEEFKNGPNNSNSDLSINTGDGVVDSGIAQFDMPGFSGTKEALAGLTVLKDKEVKDE